jgi:hypothetical protein
MNAIDRIGGGDYCPLVVTFVRVLHEKETTAPRALYIKLHSERGLFHVQPNELITGLTFAAYSTSSFCKLCADGMNVPVSLRLLVSVGLTPV